MSGNGANCVHHLNHADYANPVHTGAGERYGR